MKKTPPPGLMNDLVASLIQAQANKDVFALFALSELTDLLYSILLDEKQDDSDIAKKVRYMIKKKKVAIGQEADVPLGFQLTPVLDNLKKEGKTSYEDFQKAFCHHIAALPNKLKRFTLIFPLNFQITEKIEKTIDETAFKIIRFDELVSDFDMLKESQKLAGPKGPIDILDDKFSFFVCDDIYAGDPLWAVESCREKLECILGLLVLTKYFRKTTITLGGFPKEVSKLLVSYALVLENRNPLRTYRFRKEIDFPLSNYKFAFEEITDTDINSFFDALGQYNLITNKQIAQRLRNALIAYFSASIESDLNSAYLKYWICTEFCLLKAGTRFDAKLIDVLKRLPIWLDKKHQLAIDVLYSTRNEYVHELATNVSQYGRNTAKLIAEEVLHYLLHRGSMFRDIEELDLFLKLAGHNQEFLAKRREISELALKEIDLLAKGENLDKLTR